MERRGQDLNPAVGTDLVPETKPRLKKKKALHVPFPRMSRYTEAGMVPSGETGQLRSPESLSTTTAKPGPYSGTQSPHLRKTESVVSITFNNVALKSTHQQDMRP